ncbi:MAG: ATP-binding cassette domain-containing protein [Micropepsaceae bacterium]
MPAPIATIEHVVKRFPGSPAPAIADVSFSIRAGEITGLIGSDGAGKTTLLRLIAGLLRPTSGMISVSGIETTARTDVLHRVVAYMPQRFGLYEDLSVKENLQLYADLRGLAPDYRPQTFDRLLTFTDLHRFTARLAGHLSGGMKQKLGLACALIAKPTLLLLDEPSVGVDPISRRELWRMVRELLSGGIGVVWSTAYLDEAERCDSVVLLHEGRILFEGAAAPLTQQLNGRVFALRVPIQERRGVAAKLVRQDGVADAVIQGQHIRVVTNKGYAIGDIAAGLNGSASPLAPRFEDAFVTLTPARAAPIDDCPLAVRIRSGEGTVVEATALSKRFGDFVATDKATFSVRAGEVFGLLGPNGAGKSTIFRMLCGLLKPSSGSARVNGVDLAQSATRVRARVGYMAQKFSLYGDLSVEQNLDFFAGAYGLSGTAKAMARERVMSALGLGHLRRSQAGLLPLGFRQRLSLAAATMHDPDVIFLDEPTSGVDPITRREFWGHINAMVAKGVTVIVTTHFLEEAEYCDRVALINAGTIIALDTPDGLKRAAASPDMPEPSLDDAFVALVERSAQQTQAA